MCINSFIVFIWPQPHRCLQQNTFYSENKIFLIFWFIHFLYYSFSDPGKNHAEETFLWEPVWLGP